MKRDLKTVIELSRSIAADQERDPETREDFRVLSVWLQELKDRRDRGEPGVSRWLPTGNDPRKGRCAKCRCRSFRSYRYCPDCGRKMIQGSSQEEEQDG